MIIAAFAAGSGFGLRVNERRKDDPSTTGRNDEQRI